MKFPLEVNRWSLHVAEAAESLSKVTSEEGEIRSSKANGKDRPVLVPLLRSRSFMSDRKMKQKIDMWLQPVSAVILGDVAEHPGKKMSCKVKLSINWRVGPALACGHECLTVTCGTRLMIPTAEIR